MQSVTKPATPLGITMGCPVGVGPEIILKLFAQRRGFGQSPAVVLGDRAVLARAAELLGLAVNIVSWSPGQPLAAGTLAVLELSALKPGALRWGKPDIDTGRAMASYIKHGARLALAGELSGIVTCPIAKSALNMAGYAYPGHTEMLAELTGAAGYGMMMAGQRLRVVLVTIHQALAEVPASLSINGVMATVQMTVAALRQDLGIDEPRVAVAGFNPHAGEGGMFGREELAIIAPAVEQCAREWRVSGPWPADTIFYRAAAGEFDAVVAMYHDQGLIPFKLLHFSDGVNVTLGLPIVRTSVDHGTAYDIAGRGIADPASLAAALDLAVLIAHNRSRG